MSYRAGLVIGSLAFAICGWHKSLFLWRVHICLSIISDTSMLGLNLTCLVALGVLTHLLWCIRIGASLKCSLIFNLFLTVKKNYPNIYTKLKKIYIVKILIVLYFIDIRKFSSKLHLLLFFKTIKNNVLFLFKFYVL